MRYLQRAGYRCIPVNPHADEVLGERCYPSLADVPERIDLVPERPAGGVAMPATVSKRVFAGDVITFELRTEHGLLLRCSKPSVAEYRALAPGAPVWAVVRDCRALPRDGDGEA